MLRTLWDCVLLGDLNIHHRKWLKYSNRNRMELGMTQLVHEPTRGDHLLDLVLSSFSGVKSGVLSMIADHKPVTATLKLSVPSHVVAGRKVWRYGQADWERLHDLLADTCWDHIADKSTTAAAKWITDTTLRSASSCIPLSTLSTKKSSHPWLNDRTIALVDAKRTAEGHHWRRKRRLRAVQVLQQPITTAPPELRRKSVVSRPLPSCGGKRPRKL